MQTYNYSYSMRDKTHAHRNFTDDVDSKKK